MKITEKPLTPFELFGVDVHKGWWPIIKPICDRIQQLNAEGADIKIIQIKEKFGDLCFYVQNAPEEIHNMIAEAQKRCARTCEDCGQPAQQVVGNNRWIYTGHLQNSVDMQSINLCVNSFFTIFAIRKKERPIGYRRHHVCDEKQAGMVQ